jgi:hypothetical protein
MMENPTPDASTFASKTTPSLGPLAEFSRCRAILLTASRGPEKAPGSAGVAPAGQAISRHAPSSEVGCRTPAWDISGTSEAENVPFATGTLVAKTSPYSTPLRTQTMSTLPLPVAVPAIDTVGGFGASGSMRTKCGSAGVEIVLPVISAWAGAVMARTASTTATGRDRLMAGQSASEPPAVHRART